ncbi:uncharacterized protein LOC101450075 [Ceratitis capitata]|uniref:uncharacterized protein LOC101450075 n=1 Tax=Ceratitis capitata TaxID=7213 RepID=UPI000329C3B3|nr:uncharacterized protein LOC101450075 [Ceratitis capitata]
MSHTLVEIPQAQWTELRDLYEGQRKQACAYNTLQCLIEWQKQDAELDLSIYSLDGDWRTDGTYLAIKKNPLKHLFLNTLSENQDRLITALATLKREKNEHILVFGFPERLMSTVEQFYFDNGFPKESFETDGTAWYHIDREKALQFTAEPPAGYTLRRLEPKYAEQVNSVWPHRAPGSVLFVERMISYNDNVGVFDEANNLVAWCLRLPIGSLGLLQVMDTHKRMGLGNLVVRYMAKLIAGKGLEVTAPVVFANVPSRTMFEKLGFKVIDNVYWVLLPASE